MISKLDVKLRTPTPTSRPPPNDDSWISQTPRNPTEALSQSTLVKSRIAKHQGSSPTHIFEATTRLTKGMNRIAHELTLAQAELATLRKANEALSKHRRAKKTRVRLGGALIVGDAHDELESKDVDKQLQQEMRSNGDAGNSGRRGQCRCGNCGNIGHNARTCQIDNLLSYISNSE